MANAAQTTTASPPSARLAREWRTMEAMIHLHCRARHGGGAAPCGDCRALLSYASTRLDRCHFGAGKPTCARCPVHCYQPRWREEIRVVMRYAGPRMIWRHPILLVRHWLDGLKRVPSS